MVLALLLLFLLKQSLLFRLFLLQLLRLRLMLLLNFRSFCFASWLLRKLCVFLIVLQLDCLPFRVLLGAQLVLLLLVLLVQRSVRGGLNDRPRRSRKLVRMNCRSWGRLIVDGFGGAIRSYRTLRRPVRRTI